MSSTLEAERREAGDGAAARRASVALVGESQPTGDWGVVLGGLGFGVERFDSLEELLDASSSPALIVLWAEGALSETATRDLAPLGHGAERAPVVLVCAEIRPGELRTALACGVGGVVLEDQLSSALAPAIEAALAGQVCVPRPHSKQIEPAALSAREKQILGLVVMGYMNSQIADQLFVAESTVKSHLSSAFGKLGVRSRNEAVELILDTERGLGVGILSLGGEPVT